MENAMRFPLLCSRSAPKGGSTRNACGCFSKKNSLIHPPFTYKKAHLAMCFFAGIVDSFNSAGLHLCNTPKRQHRKVVRHAMRVAVFSKNSLIHPLSHTKKHILRCAFSGGEGWIRTTEVTDNRFTVCSLWPLGNLSIGAGDRNRTNNLLITNQLLCLLSYTSVLSCWCLGADSNHRHRDFQSLALPPELPRHIVDPTYSTVTRRIEFWFGGL